MGFVAASSQVVFAHSQKERLWNGLDWWPCVNATFHPESVKTGSGPLLRSIKRDNCSALANFNATGINGHIGVLEPPHIFGEAVKIPPLFK